MWVHKTSSKVIPQEVYDQLKDVHKASFRYDGELEEELLIDGDAIYMDMEVEGLEDVPEVLSKDLTVKEAKELAEGLDLDSVIRFTEGEDRKSILNIVKRRKEEEL